MSIESVYLKLIYACWLTGIVFVALKLFSVINLSWWWVIFPLWGGIGLVVSLKVFLGIILGIIKAYKNKDVSSTTRFSNVYGGIIGAAGIVFVALKLFGIIDWSWWWVTLPLWGSAMFTIAIMIIGLIIGVFINKNR